MNIAIDFDDTFTADMVLFGTFIANAKARGHNCYIVTARRQTEENIDTVDYWLSIFKCQVPVIFSELGSKIDAVERRGIKIDIWIDDDPTTLVRGH